MNTYEKESEMQQTAQEAVSDLTENAKEQAEIAKQKLAQFNDKAITYVKENPLMSLGISLGVGALLGFLCRRTT
jgi:ElaB/YqjD/DUF883 family membrane-anchored ribosome-binding protein